MSKEKTRPRLAGGTKKYKKKSKKKSSHKESEESYSGQSPTDSSKMNLRREGSGETVQIHKKAKLKRRNSQQGLNSPMGKFKFGKPME